MKKKISVTLQYSIFPQVYMRQSSCKWKYKKYFLWNLPVMEYFPSRIQLLCLNKRFKANVYCILCLLIVLCKIKEILVRYILLFKMLRIHKYTPFTPH